VTSAPTSGTQVVTTVKATGIQVGDKVEAIPPTTLGTNLVYNAYVSAAGTITLSVVATGVPSGNATGNWSFIWTKLTA
jgi:hypothetical protein